MYSIVKKNAMATVGCSNCIIESFIHASWGLFQLRMGPLLKEAKRGIPKHVQSRVESVEELEDDHPIFYKNKTKKKKKKQFDLANVPCSNEVT